MTLLGKGLLYLITALGLVKGHYLENHTSISTMTADFVLTAALEGNGQAQYRSRHNKTDLTSVVTALLVQLDCAVTTTHQCLTKDIMDKDCR